MVVQGVGDLLEDNFGLVQHFMVPESQDTIAKLG
jgi:hypothetical protein